MRLDIAPRSIDRDSIFGAMTLIIAMLGMRATCCRLCSIICALSGSRRGLLDLHRESASQFADDAHMSASAAECDAALDAETHRSPALLFFFVFFSLHEAREEDLRSFFFLGTNDGCGRDAGRDCPGRSEAAP